MRFGRYLGQMIGQFAFHSFITEGDVVLEMAWAGAIASGRVLISDWVRDALATNEIPARAEDDLIGLPFALSYGVLVATLSGARLTLTGDRTVWPEEWGVLDTGRRHLHAVKSH